VVRFACLQYRTSKWQICILEPLTKWLSCRVTLGFIGRGGRGAVHTTEIRSRHTLSSLSLPTPHPLLPAYSFFWIWKSPVLSPELKLWAADSSSAQPGWRVPGSGDGSSSCEGQVWPLLAFLGSLLTSLDVDASDYWEPGRICRVLKM
jgi:hypothetical protein